MSTYWFLKSIVCYVGGIGLRLGTGAFASMASRCDPNRVGAARHSFGDVEKANRPSLCLKKKVPARDERFSTFVPLLGVFGFGAAVSGLDYACRGGGFLRMSRFHRSSCLFLYVCGFDEEGGKFVLVVLGALWAIGKLWAMIWDPLAL